MAGQKILEPTPAEHHWVAGNNELAGKIAQGYGHEVRAGDVLAPTVLDRAWDRWMSERDPADDPNPYINAFGTALGWYLVDRLELEWKVVKDDAGTEMAVWSRAGDLLVFPANLVAKRFSAGTTSFFADVAQQTEDAVARVRTEGAPPPQKRGIGRFFGRS
jgi:hypothetical protein